MKDASETAYRPNESGEIKNLRAACGTARCHGRTMEGSRAAHLTDSASTVNIRRASRTALMARASCPYNWRIRAVILSGPTILDVDERQSGIDQVVIWETVILDSRSLIGQDARRDTVVATIN